MEEVEDGQIASIYYEARKRVNPYDYSQPDIKIGTRIRVVAKNTRNKPCPCGSKKKFKNCCISKLTSETMYKVIN